MLNNINKLKDVIILLYKIKHNEPFEIEFNQYKLIIYKIRPTYKLYFEYIISILINGHRHRLKFTEPFDGNIVISNNQNDHYLEYINNKLNNDLLFDEINKYIEQLILEEI
jgi:hypothetical protein